MYSIEENQERTKQCDYRIRMWEGKSLIMQNSKRVQVRAKKSKKVRAGMTINIATAPAPFVLTKLNRDVVVDPFNSF